MRNTGKAAEAVAGRATGVLFFAGFGSLWLFSGLATMHRLNVVGIGAILVIAASLIVPALRLMRAATNASSAAPPTEAEATSHRTFNRINAAQWIAIAGSALLLNVFRHEQLLVPVISFIVGMHLFPLAKLFDYPAHYVTGWLLVLWSGGVVALASNASFAPLGATGAGVILLGSAAWTLTEATRAAKSRFGFRMTAPFAAS